ncbi:MAG: DUF58 domain-containing protein [Cyanobacteria bacterium REEB459]|nr:DUF58 domain-containing protein [Cyanobacteria bacterium REEB459]
MPFLQRQLEALTQALENHWVNPAYSGWLLLALAIAFFAAATNTLAGWLYVISGVLLALLAIAAPLSRRQVRGLVVERQPLQPVMAGETLVMVIRLHNPRLFRQGPWQLLDPIPQELGSIAPVAVDSLAAGHSHRLAYTLTTRQRGGYSWPQLVLRSAAPLGLCWSRRAWRAPARVLVYPQILPLRRCPWLHSLSQAGAAPADRPYPEGRQEGLTRSLRPYRWGDPTRLIHWRTSARYGDFRLRELEPCRPPTPPLIALNTTAPWLGPDFEQAVIVAASLYSYLHQQGWSARLWLPSQTGSGISLEERSAVLAALATILPSPGPTLVTLPGSVLLWITAGPEPTAGLPAGTKQILWGVGPPGLADHTCRWIDAQIPLAAQLEADDTPLQSVLGSEATVEKELPQPQL